MKTGKIFIPILLLFFGLGAATAQFNFLPISADYAIFRSPSGKFYLEIYAGSLQKNFSYQKTGNVYRASYHAEVSIFQEDSLIAYDSHSRHNDIADERKIVSSRLFVNTFVFELNAGVYRARVNLRDINSGKTGTFRLDVNIDAPADRKLALSQIQLAGLIKKSEEPSEFSKNGYFILPNPAREFEASQPMLYYYLEIYNLFQQGEYSVRQVVEDTRGDFSREYPPKFYPKPGNSSVNVSATNLIGLPGGEYRLKIIVHNPSTGESDSSQTAFSYFNALRPPLAQNTDSSNYRPERPNIDVSEFAAMSETELDEYFEKLRYKLSDRAAELFQSLDKNEKMYFLANFWRENDPTPGTELNEFKRDYQQRLEYAETHFSGRGKNGWKTDRGRALLTYGAPDDVEKYPMEMDKKPYEIWTYHKLQGGAQFFFANIKDFGEYELVHSTMRNEIYQPNWRQYIKRNRGEGFDADGF